MKKRFYIALLMVIATASAAFSQSKTITGGNDHGVIICAQGYLYTWGNNYSKTVGGPLLGIDPDDPATGGNATKDFVTVPSRVKSGNLTFSQVTAGSGAFNIALACNTLVYAWGENTQGGCGQGTGGDNVVKYPVPVLKGETPGYNEDGTPGGKYLGGVTYVAACTNSGFAIMDDGRVVGWGNGEWNGSSNKTTPVYIKDKDGNDIKNVTHISGGDDNVLIRTADGMLYGVGPFNGNLGTGTTIGKGTTYAVPVLKAEDGTQLTDIRMSAAGDVCGFAVTGDGYVWSWGQGGWGGSTGVSQNGNNHGRAKKVMAGEYQTISGEEYLTDVKEVIGGRGHGAAVTKEGYLVYWGCNEGNGGVAPANIGKTSEYSRGDGVMPILAHYCDASGKPGPVVKNAVSISRGDNFDFMMNDEDKYYVWGLNDLGQCGVGTSVSQYNCLVELKTIPCDIQDNCPEVFMIDRVKCPGEEIELDCGFVVPKGKEERYFIEWFSEGKSLNKSKKTDSESARKADPFNVASIKITDPGKYGVLVEYIGNNIPCDKCKPAETEITVSDMDMPIDTLITDMQCVAEPLKPGAADVVCFEAVVNAKFYNSKQKVSFAAFSTETGAKDTLKDSDGKSIVIETTGAGGEIKFCVSGDQIKKIVDNSKEESKDTIYNVWLEDVSKFETMLRKGKPGAAAQGGSFLSYGILLDMYASADLYSFDFYAKSYSGETSMTVTPVLYAADKNANGIYVVGKQIWSGKAQKFTIDDSGPNKCTVICDTRIEGSSARGVRYILGMSFTGQVNAQIFEESTPAMKQNEPEYVTPVLDSEKFGIYEMGATANSYTAMSNPAQKTCYYNVTFGKLTDYNCGRILLSARYGCPPCDRPDAEGSKYVTITSDATPNSDGAVELCKESPKLTLNIEKLKFEGKESKDKFDILWFDQFKDLKDAKALASSDGNASSLVLQTDWETVAGAADITEDVEKTYYVKVRDHEKPESADCFVFDSIKVIAHPAPTEVIDDITFCIGKFDGSDFTVDGGKALSGKTIKWVKEPTDIAGMETSDTFDYTLVDDETGCEGEPHTLTITVNKTEKPDVKTEVSQLKEAGKHYSLSSGVNSVADDCEIKWYKNEDDTTPMSASAEDIPLDEATPKDDPIVVWAEQVNKETGCASERVKVEITINDAPVPEVESEHLCIGDKITTLEDYIINKKAGYQFNWYTDKSAAKGSGSTTAPSFEATESNVGDGNKFYVSQTNTETGAESEKATITVTVHQVATLDLSKNKTEYCIGEAGAVGEELVFTANSDGDFTSAVWSDNSAFATKKEKWSPAIDEAGEFTYYVRPSYENDGAYLTTNASAVCVGKDQEIKITVNKTEKPESDKNFTIQYMKDKQPFVPVLTQESTAVKVATGHTLQWYDEDGNKISEPTPPEYPSTATGDKRYYYYVSQINDATGCESEKVKVTVVISGYPVPEVDPIEFCEPSSNETISGTLSAKINLAPGQTESQYTLLWYDTDPGDDPLAPYKTSINLEDYASEFSSFTGKEYKKTFYVRQRFETHTDAMPAQSACAELVVTVYARPRLTTTNPDAVCLGEKVDLRTLYEVSNEVVMKVNAVFTDDLGGSVSNDALVGEAGIYKVQGFFHLDAIDKDCKSNWENIEVSVDELEVAIDGSATTCPGVPVDLQSVLTTNVKSASKISYSWKTSAGETGTTENFNTKEAGLSKAGDKLTVDLTVTAGACKDKKADKFVIEVGDGPVNATLTFVESKNANSGKSYTVTDRKNGPTFAGCGGDVVLKLSDVAHTESDFTFTSDKGHNGEGKFTNGSAEMGVKPGTYTVSYINKCATQFVFTVKDVSVSATEEHTNSDICEDQQFTATLLITKASPSESCTIEWYRDGELLNETSDVLAIAKAKVSDSGVYSYKLTSVGCTYEDYIISKLPLKVKPRIKVSDNFVSHYEVTRGEDMAMEIPFDVPSDPSEISSEILWYEDGSQTLTGNKVTEKEVTSNHEYEVRIDPDGYCGTKVNVNLLVDAKLKIKAELDATDMCIGENHILTVDTAGTGKILHPDKLVFKVEEIVDGVAKELTLLRSDNQLAVRISPNPQDKTNRKAVYKVTYTYAGQTPTQDETVDNLTLTVHDAFDIQWTPANLTLCEGSQGDIEITKIYPNDTEIQWVPDDDLVTYGATGASVRPVFTAASGYRQTKRLHLIATNEYCRPADYYPVITVDKPLEGEVKAPEFACEGHDVKIDASSYAADTYTWTSADQLGEGETLSGSSITVKPKPEFATYDLAMTRGSCSANTEATVVITYAPVVAGVDSLDYRSVEIVVEPGTGTEPFKYVIDGNSDDPDVETSVQFDLEYGKHEVVITDVAGCVVKYSFNINAPSLGFPIVISPNDDGIGDRFYDRVLAEAYPNAMVRVFDRWGKLVAEYKAGESDGWDGTYNGNPLPSTDYWYEVQIEEIQKSYSGHFTLMRQ